MLPPHRYYYLHNFQRALGVIADRYADLLDEKERQFLLDFAVLPHVSQALFVRLAMRRGPWFRAVRVQYDEIPDSVSAAAPLVALGWIEDDALMSLDELFSLCTLPDLRNVFATSGSSGLRKSQWLEELRNAYPDARRYDQWMAPDTDRAWYFTMSALVDRLRLMFFGNLRQDWSEFVLADLGIFRYETVDFDQASRAFQQRCDIDCYLALHACRSSLEEGASITEVITALQACVSDNAWLEQRRARILYQVGQACEREKNWDLAYRTYEQCRYPGARQRCVRVLERMLRYDEAFVLANHALDDPESEAESQAIHRMLPRLRRHAGYPAAMRSTASQIKRIDLRLPRSADGWSVEYVAKQVLQEDAAPVYYVENTLINALFGLLCWPAIFASLPGAFFHPFQRGPADLAAPDFVTRRADLFSACLSALDTDVYREMIVKRYHEKQGCQSPFVQWEAVSEPLLRLALQCISPDHLKIFFRRFLANIIENRTGLPDLIQFWPEEHRYELIEVKGPGDKLQDNQTRWLNYCVAHGVPVCVAYAQWDDSVS